MEINSFYFWEQKKVVSLFSFTSLCVCIPFSFPLSSCTHQCNIFFFLHISRLSLKEYELVASFFVSSTRLSFSRSLMPMIRQNFNENLLHNKDLFFFFPIDFLATLQFCLPLILPQRFKQVLRFSRNNGVIPFYLVYLVTSLELHFGICNAIL